MKKFTDISVGDVLQTPDGSPFTVTSAPAIQDDGVNYKMVGIISGEEINQTDCEWFGLADSEADVYHTSNGGEASL